MPLRLTWLETTTLAVEFQGLAPESFRGRSVYEISQHVGRVGKSKVSLGDLFRIEGEADDVLNLDGDLSHVRGIGQGMSTGSIVIHGNAGPRLGMQMSGGSIEVYGNVDGWAGAEMRGGVLKVHGNAGDYAGASLPGSRSGMREGMILIDGDVGDDVGLSMRRGLISVGGKAGSGLGRAMIAGTMIAVGGVGQGAGCSMKRGSLVLFGVEPGTLLPTFARAGRYRPPYWSIYARRLIELGVALPSQAMKGIPARYNGDLAAGGQGEVLLWDRES